MHILLMSYPLDHRVAFVLLCLLLIAAAVPLGFAWACIIPPEVSDDRENDQPLNRWAVVLLCLTTVSFAARLPGVPLAAVRDALLSHLSMAWAQGVEFAIVAILIVIPGVASAYAALRLPPRLDPLRWPLLWSGLLVTLVWLIAPFLSARWLAP